MMRSISALGIAVSLLTMPYALAQTQDMAKITCDNLTHADHDSLLVVVAWMSGYYNAKHDNTVLTQEKLTANVEKVFQFCGANPTMTVMQAVEKIIPSP